MHTDRANLSELDRRLKGTSFRDATELHTLAAILKVASDLIEDILLALFAQLRMTQLRMTQARKCESQILIENALRAHFPKK